MILFIKISNLVFRSRVLLLRLKSCEFLESYRALRISHGSRRNASVEYRVSWPSCVHAMRYYDLISSEKRRDRLESRIAPWPSGLSRFGNSTGTKIAWRSPGSWYARKGGQPKMTLSFDVAYSSCMVSAFNFIFLCYYSKFRISRLVLEKITSQEIWTFHYSEK